MVTAHHACLGQILRSMWPWNPESLIFWVTSTKPPFPLWVSTCRCASTLTTSMRQVSSPQQGNAKTRTQGMKVFGQGQFLNLEIAVKVLYVYVSNIENRAGCAFNLSINHEPGPLQLILARHPNSGLVCVLQSGLHQNIGCYYSFLQSSNGFNTWYPPCNSVKVYFTL